MQMPANALPTTELLRTAVVSRNFSQMTAFSRPITTPSPMMNSIRMIAYSRFRFSLFLYPSRCLASPRSPALNMASSRSLTLSTLTNMPPVLSAIRFMRFSSAPIKPTVPMDIPSAAYSSNTGRISLYISDPALTLSVDTPSLKKMTRAFSLERSVFLFLISCIKVSRVSLMAVSPILESRG